MNDDEGFFECPPDWRQKWEEAGMPEYRQEDLQPWQSVVCGFETVHERESLVRLMGHRPRTNTNLTMKWVWFPFQEYNKWTDQKAPPFQVGPNRYPVYVISKGRSGSLITVRNLEHLMIPYRLVIEPQELGKYERAFKKWGLSLRDRSQSDKIILLPEKNWGKGCSIPARNWVWDHSIKRGDERHWVLDDNIQGFFKLNRNEKPKVRDFNPFAVVEDFTDHWANVGLSGMNYEFFVQRRVAAPAFLQNTRVYSCILVKNDLKEKDGSPMRWRGRYNEDTDLSLRVLKTGMCTILFNHLTAKKVTTMVVKGGNTESLYKGDGRLKMAESLMEQHPDLVEIARKWGRWQHQVDYAPFKKNKLKAKRK